MNIEQNEVVISITEKEYEYYHKNFKEPIHAFGKKWFITQMQSKMNPHTYRNEWTAILRCYP